MLKGWANLSNIDSKGFNFRRMSSLQFCTSFIYTYRGSKTHYTTLIVNIIAIMLTSLIDKGLKVII